MSEKPISAKIVSEEVAEMQSQLPGYDEDHLTFICSFQFFRKNTEVNFKYALEKKHSELPEKLTGVEWSKLPKEYRQYYAPDNIIELIDEAFFDSVGLTDGIHLTTMHHEDIVEQMASQKDV